MGGWIAKATSKNKGSLRKTLGASKGKPIPSKKLAKAASGKGVSKKTQKRAILAETLKKINKGK